MGVVALKPPFFWRYVMGQKSQAVEMIWDCLDWYSGKKTPRAAAAGGPGLDGEDDWPDSGSLDDDFEPGGDDEEDLLDSMDDEDPDEWDEWDYGEDDDDYPF
jgi:hypothetical protein